MLLEFRVSNFCSIGKEVVLSMLAGQDKKSGDELLHFEKYTVLPSCVIYGANGTGKTNLLKAMKFFQQTVLTSYNNPPEAVLLLPTHKTMENEKSGFAVQFVADGIRYAYGVEFKKGYVESEYLYYFPKKREAKVFERHGNKIVRGSKFKDDFVLVEEALKPNRLFLSCAANLSKNPVLNSVYLYFGKKWILDYSSDEMWLDQSLKLLTSRKDMKEKFSKFLKSLDIPIRDFMIDQNAFSVDEIEMPDFMRDFLKQAQQSELVNVKVLLDYGNFSIELNEESSGVQKLFRVLCPIIDALEHGCLIFFDEFENGLHEFIVSRIIQYFNRYAHVHDAQLVLITHNTSLLSSTLFRRDQIWFTEMEPEKRFTDLYSMVELKGIRQNENFRNNYIEGKYGGIPMLGSWVTNKEPQ